MNQSDNAGWHLSSLDRELIEHFRRASEPSKILTYVLSQSPEIAPLIIDSVRACNELQAERAVDILFAIYDECHSDEVFRSLLSDASYWSGMNALEEDKHQEALDHLRNASLMGNLQAGEVLEQSFFPEEIGERFFLDRAQEKETQGDKDGMLTDLIHAINLKTELPRPYVVVGMSIYTKGGDKQLAVELFNKSIELDDANFFAYWWRAMAREDLGDLIGAIEDYSKAISIDSDDSTCFTNRGTAKMLLGDVKGAEEDWTKAVELGDPDAPQLLAKYINH